MDKPKYDVTGARLAWWRKRLLGLALLTVPLPYVVYFVNPTFTVLNPETNSYISREISPLMIPWAILHLLVYVLVCYETLHAARLSVSTGNLPVQNSHSVIVNWWSVVSNSLRSHVVMAISRLGFVVALAQVFHIGHIKGYNLPTHIFYPYNYGSHMGEGRTVATNPQWETTLLGLLVMIGFAVVNSALLVAIGQHIFYLRPYKSNWQLLLKRTGIIVIVLGMTIGIFAVDGIVKRFHNSTNNFFLYSFDSVEAAIAKNYRVYMYRSSNGCLNIVLNVCTLTYRDFMEGTQLLSVALVDNGTLLTTNMLRPFNENSAFGYQYYYPGVGWTVTNTEFVLKNLLVALVGMLFIGGWTSWHLWRIHRLSHV